MVEPSLVRLPFSGGELLAGFSTRGGGVSAPPYDSLNLGAHVGDDPEHVLANRIRLRDRLGLRSLTFADQQHHAHVAVVDATNAGRGFTGVDDARAAFPDTDALVTDLPDAGLAILVADCAPVLLWDPEHHAVGGAHCGRNGIVEGVLPATITTMSETYGTDPARLRVGVGPCIKQASYEVGQAEADAFRAAFPGIDVTTQTRPGHYLLDLMGPLRAQLAQAGVPSTQVHVMSDDTFGDQGRWFSDRRARPCGRFAGIIALRAS